MATMKYKANLSISAFNSDNKIRTHIELSTHSLKILIIDKLSFCQNEIILGLFVPINHNKSTNEYLINYSLINNVQQNSTLKDSIILEILNPVLNNSFTIILSDFQNMSLLFKKKINSNLVATHIRKKIKEEIKFLIVGLNNMVFALKDLMEKCKKFKILDNLKDEAYKFGKKYYEETADAFKKNNKIIKGVNNEELILKLKEIELNLPKQEKIKKGISYTPFDSLLSEFNIRTTFFIEETTVVFLKIICISINMFDDLQFNQFNINKIFEEHEENNNINNINNFNNINIPPQNKSFNNGSYKQKNLLNNNINTNYNNISDSQKNGESSSTEQTKKKKKNNRKSQDDSKIQTPKFKQYNYQTNNNAMKLFTQNFSENNNNKKIIMNPMEDIMNLTKVIVNKKITSLNGLNKEIEELIQIHSFVTPNDIFNIFCNASEIIHRKFFQLTINSYLGKVFYVEEDKSGIIKIEDLYNSFLYIRALKIMLFSDTKKENIVSNMLMEGIV